MGYCTGIQKPRRDMSWIEACGKEICSIASILALALALFQLYTACFGLLTAMHQRGIHITLAVALVFITYPSASGKWRKTDYLLVGVTLSVGIYLLVACSPAKMTAKAVVGPSTTDLFVGAVLIALVLEGTRRACGLPLVIVSILALLYGYGGAWLPSILGHKGYGVDQLIEQSVFTHEGIFGVPLSVSATFVSLFILFGSFLEASGAGYFFTQAALALTGRSRSGPAQAAVVSSAMMGTISGSAVANVVTTGTFTIPLMKRMGYAPEFAGAVEAVASTGGQIMPPVMGAAAFIIAEILNIKYSQVAIAAAIPAVLYFVSLGFMVHFEALRLGLRVMDRSELPDLKVVLKKGYFYLLPLVVLVYLLIIISYTPTKAALYSLVAVVLASFLGREARMTPDRILRALINGSKSVLPVATACAAAGIVIGVVTITGLGLRMSNLIVTLSGGSLFIALILTMITCMLLGMAVPTSAAYIITASLGAPALIRLGVSPLAAHLFVFYFACISAITPPVALAAYAGAGVAGSDPMRTGFIATKLGVAAYIVPFMFVYGPPLILVGPPWEVLLAGVTSTVGVFLLASGFEGWLHGPASWIERVLLIAGSLLLIKPGIGTDLLALLPVGIAYSLHFSKYRRARVVASRISSLREP